MLGTSLVPFYIVMAVLCIGMVWPDNEDKPSPDAPKKGFWQAKDALWPIRNAYSGLRSANLALRHGSRNAISLAVVVAIVTDILARHFKVPETSSQVWFLLECGGVSFLVGRASGFWSADRRLRSDRKKPSESA
jgi:hypothetical protein